MTTTLNRGAADALLAGLDAWVRNALPANSEEPEEPEGEGETLDPEQAKARIMDAVKEELGWDGKTGDPNASKDAFEDALADMFDADVDILWNGKDALTLQVEGEDPVPLTGDYLGELLEALATSGGPGGEADQVADEDAGNDDDGEDGDNRERGYQVIWQRSGVLDKDKHLHAPKGIGGGRFVSKGGGVGGAVGKAVKAAGHAADNAAGKAGDKSGGKAVSAAKPGGAGKGPHAVNLAKRAKGRAGPRATGRAVGDALSKGTGKRVKVSGDKDGSLYIRTPLGKKKVSAKKAAVLTIASWMAGAALVGVVGAIAGPAAIPLGVAIDVAAITKLVKIIRAG